MDDQKGHLFVVGIGPGNLEEMTGRVRQALEQCEVVVGYQRYIDLIRPLIDGKVVIESGMGKEQDRCAAALREALTGKKVALVSSGDAGIYGMAGIVLEIAQKKGIEDTGAIEIVPGVPGFVAAASLVGAPLMNDFASVSLSDILTPWETIERRLAAAASGDFVTCLYNPKSAKRVRQIVLARDIFLRFRDKETPCAVVRNAARPSQKVITTTLEDMPFADIDMMCIVIIGNSDTKAAGNWLITSRGYAIKGGV